ncbi:MAG: DM13 domain-containing protein [Anaerolineae bacterium]|nr:DM13 domain-containing protein [Anaerolineae bacterium]
MNFPSKKRRIILMVSIILAIPVLALAWWLGSPIFIKDEVNEELPENLIIITPTTADPEAVLASDDSENDASETETTTTEQVTAVEIKRGPFRNGDSFHQGSGDAIIYQLSTGEHLLRFENFEVTNGPGLHVYLVPRANQDSVNINGYIDLGALKGNVGSQNYTIPAEVEIPTEASVVIWCEPFAVLFSVASLQ